MQIPRQRGMMQILNKIQALPFTALFKMCWLKFRWSSSTFRSERVDIITVQTIYGKGHGKELVQGFFISELSHGLL